MNKINTLVIGLSATVALLIGTLFGQNSEPILGGNANLATKFNVASTSAIVAVTTNTRIVGSSTPDRPRAYTSICNDSAQVVYLGMNGDKAMTALTGIRVAAGACYEINSENLYTGAIRASSTNETSSSIIVNDYTL